MNSVRKDKYCLKGEYYETLEVINSRISTYISRSFKKELCGDILELLYRNQVMGKPIKDVLGGDVNSFISSILETYFSTMSKKKIIIYVLKYALLYSILCSLYPIAIYYIGIGNINIYSLSTIMCSIFGFVSGMVIGISKFKVYKIENEKRYLLETIVEIIPFLTIIISDGLQFNILANYDISNYIIILIIILEVLLYFIVLKTLNKEREI